MTETRGPGPAQSPAVISLLIMHQLFRLVLGQKDLSRAGDLFSLDDSEIEDSLTEALEQIKIISSSSVSKPVCELDAGMTPSGAQRLYVFWGEGIFVGGGGRALSTPCPCNGARWFSSASKE